MASACLSAVAGDAMERDPVRLVERLNGMSSRRESAVTMLVDLLRGNYRGETLTVLARELERGNLLTRLGCVETLGRVGDEDATDLLLRWLPAIDDPLVRSRIIRTLPACWFPNDERRRRQWLEYAETAGATLPPALLDAFLFSLPMGGDGRFDAQQDERRRRIGFALAGELDPLSASLAAMNIPRLRDAATAAAAAMAGDRLGYPPSQWSERWGALREYAALADANTLNSLRSLAALTLGETAAEAYPEILSALDAVLNDPDHSLREAAWRAVERMAMATADRSIAVSPGRSPSASIDASAPPVPIERPGGSLFARAGPPSDLDLPVSGAEADAALLDAFQRAGRIDPYHRPSAEPPTTTDPQPRTTPSDPTPPPPASATPSPGTDSPSPADPTEPGPADASVLDDAFDKRRRRHADELAAWGLPRAHTALKDVHPGVVARAAGALALLSGGQGADAEAALSSLEDLLSRSGMEVSSRAEALASCGLLPSVRSVRILASAVRAAPNTHNADGLPEGFPLATAALDGLARLARRGEDDPVGHAALGALREASGIEVPVANAPNRMTLGGMAVIRLKMVAPR